MVKESNKMQNYIKFHNHYIDKSLYQFMCKDLENERLKIDEIFLKKLSDIISSLEKRRISLIEKRAFLQNQITAVKIFRRQKIMNLSFHLLLKKTYSNLKKKLLQTL